MCKSHPEESGLHKAGFFVFVKHTNTMTRYIEEKEFEAYKAGMEKILAKCLYYQECNLIKIKELRERVEELEDKYEPDRELTREEIDVFFNDLKLKLK